jgi:kynurenine 3-monooxygenase
MTPGNSDTITIAGAGLAGALLATLLAKQGWQVDVFEKRPDPRAHGFIGGRSINLALAERGLHALRQAGLEHEVMAQAVMMRGRMVHFIEGHTQLQRYGRDDSEVIWSVHRGRLNELLIGAAEAAGARLHFGQRLDAVDFDQSRITLVAEDTGTRTQRPFGTLLGADGAGSAVREAMKPHEPLFERFEPLGHGYKELEIPPTADGGFRIEPHALHIWPRGGYMCIALPNTEQTFTVTLFLPNEGETSFADVVTASDARSLFERDFADALELIPELEADFSNNPTGVLGTLFLERWHHKGKALLLGDAAHAMVPFHGQGMNCAFEDCVELATCLASAPGFEDAFAQFESIRRPNALAIQRMAVENYIEMRDRVDDADYLLQRELEQQLAERHPDRFVPRYSMVSFRRIPYLLALQRGEIQRALLQRATSGLSSLDQVDLTALDEAVRQQLSALPPR